MPVFYAFVCCFQGVPAAKSLPRQRRTTSPAIPEELANQSSEAANADLTCTVTLGNRPTDTEPDAVQALYEGYKATMAGQYPNVTVIPAYYSYTLSNYVTMTKGGIAPGIFQPPLRGSSSIPEKRRIFLSAFAYPAASPMPTL